MSWQRTHACWRRLSRAADPDVVDMTWQAMVVDLRRALWEAGWSVQDLAGPLAPNIELRIATAHADYSAPDTVALLVEARALQLLNPDPLPDMRWRRRKAT